MRSSVFSRRKGQYLGGVPPTINKFSRHETVRFVRMARGTGCHGPRDEDGNEVKNEWVAREKSAEGIRRRQDNKTLTAQLDSKQRQ